MAEASKNRKLLLRSLRTLEVNVLVFKAAIRVLYASTDLEFSSKENREYAEEVHNKLLTTLACEYLNQSISDYYIRFKMQTKKYLKTPHEQALKEPGEIFNELEKKDLLGVGYYEVLLKVVNGIDVAIDDLIEQADEKIKDRLETDRQQNGKVVKDSASHGDGVMDRTPTERELSKVSRLVGFDFQLMGVELGVDYVKIQHIIMNNQNDAQSQIFHTLLSWKQKEGRNATVGKLINALRDRDVDLDKIKEIFDVS